MADPVRDAVRAGLELSRANSTGKGGLVDVLARRFKRRLERLDDEQLHDVVRQMRASDPAFAAAYDRQLREMQELRCPPDDGKAALWALL